MTILQEKSPTTGQATGATSIARVLALVFGVIAVVIAGNELAVDVIERLIPPRNLAYQPSYLRYTLSVMFGIVAVGFYLGRAGGAFNKVIDRFLARG